MLHDYVKTSLPFRYDQTAEQLLTNPAFEDWTGAAPNDTPDGWTVNSGQAQITEDANGLAASGVFNIEQDVMVVGHEYLILINIIEYTDGDIALYCGATFINAFSSAGVMAVEFTATDTEFQIDGSSAGSVDFVIRYAYVIDITDGYNFNNLVTLLGCCPDDYTELMVKTDRKHFPTFQIKSTTEDPFPGIALYDTDGNIVVTEAAVLLELSNDIEIYNDGEYVWYIYEASTNFTNSITVGEYYFVFTLTDGLESDIYYSQPIQVCDFTADIDESVSFTDCEEYNESNFIRLEWWSECDFDNIIYQYGFRNRLWLDGMLDTPRPEITKDTNDNDNRYTANYMSLKNFYQLKVLIPEYMYDALIRLPLYGSEGSNGHVAMTMPDGSCGELHEINITAEWQENSCLCHLTIEFLDDEYPLRMGNCCGDYDLSLTT